MKAIKTIKEVGIHWFFKGTKRYYWRIIGDFGITDNKEIDSTNDYATEQSCKNNFRKFAKLNGIKNYKFI